MAKPYTVALLPMKAHSERVSGKNFRLLQGRPLFRYILDSLLAVDQIDMVVINTDAREILAENGLEEGPRVKIRDRRSELCGDFVSMNLILKDDMEAVPADRYVMTHTTNPLLSADTIEKGLSLYDLNMRTGDADSVFTVNKVQTRFYSQDMTAVNHDPSNLVRTQDLEPWFEENSCLYIFSRDSFAKTGARIVASPTILETPPLEAIDIDEESDWIMADALILRKNTYGGATS